MAPSLGRIVLVELPAGEEFNGSRIHPAVVTAVHSETMINARVFVDADKNPLWLTSIPRADTGGYGGAVWSWPPQVQGEPT
jgi:hypothetical protein